LLAIATDVLKLARAGLARRRRFDVSGRDETHFLDVLEDRVARGTTPAQELLDKFHGKWAGSVDPIYAEEAY
jgi:glutamate--cysteine ligase